MNTETKSPDTYVFWKHDRFPYFDGAKAVRIIDDHENKAQLENGSVEYFAMLQGRRGADLLELRKVILSEERMEYSHVRETAENALAKFFEERSLTDTMYATYHKLHVGERPGEERIETFKQAVEHRLQPTT